MTTGPGCGGKNPCVTDNAVTIGSPNFNIDTFARLATVNTSGINSTRPTSKMRNTNDKCCYQHSPLNMFLKTFNSVSAIRVAPPPSANNFNIAPKPKIKNMT